DRAAPRVPRRHRRDHSPGHDHDHHSRVRDREVVASDPPQPDSAPDPRGPRLQARQGRYERAVPPESDVSLVTESSSTAAAISWMFVSGSFSTNVLSSMALSGKTSSTMVATEAGVRERPW